MEPLLLVEDKPELRAVLRKALERWGWKVDEAPDGTAALDKLRRVRYLLVLTDLKLPGCSGLDVLRGVKEADATIPVILMTAFGSVEEAVTAMKEGAFDFIQKPVDLDHLKLLVERGARQQELLRENLLLREDYAARYGFPRIVGEHAAIAAIGQQVQRVAAAETTVLLLGESGTGKELFARAVHDQSDRNTGPFIQLNCAALPEVLIESALFGHERGAFTGAIKRVEGAFERAHRGTLLLDEVSEMRLDLQTKLLRVLQEQEFERVGGTSPIRVDVRIIATTNRDLAAEAAAGTFRRDLYYRLGVIPILIPPLRERPEDIAPLAMRFAVKTGQEMKKEVRGMSAEAIEFLTQQEWFGNVRELQHAVERAVILSSEPVLQVHAFDSVRFGLTPVHGVNTVRAAPAATAGGVPAPRLAASVPSGEFIPVPHAAHRSTPRNSGAVPAVGSPEVTLTTLNVAEAERALIARALETAGGNRTRAADLLGMSVRTLRNKLNNPSDHEPGDEDLPS